MNGAQELETAACSLQAELRQLPRPLLILSTAVGRGMYSIGEALLERTGSDDVEHRAIEDFLPPAAMREDVERYRAISSKFPWLLNIAYRLPLIYQRKLWRERGRKQTDISSLSKHITDGGFRSVLTVSHRPTFWAALAKERAGLDMPLVGVSGEYGSSLGWRYVPWSAVERFLSPVPREEIRFPIPGATTFAEVPLPVRREYEELAQTPGDSNQVLVVCGLWGQGPIDRLLSELRGLSADLTLHAVCGENARLLRAVEAMNDSQVHAHGVVSSLAPLMKRCGSVVTKPGIATILEAHGARRPMFLIRGMPVAEDNNLRHALEHMDSQMYSQDAFRSWHRSVAERQAT